MRINEKYQTVERPIKVLQFGEGNFLRAFVDWIIQNMNESNEVDFSSNVAVVQPLSFGLVEKIAEQQGLYTVLLEGLMNGQVIEEQKVINSLSDFINPYTDYEKLLEYAKSKDLQYIISNTTEAGIVLDVNDTDFTQTPNSYPGKLLSILKTRYDYFNGSDESALDIMPCELIDNNGDTLKKVLIELAKINNLDEKFIDWLANKNRYYNTLVDRIVPGYPRNDAEKIWEKLGYVDNFMVKGEIFHLWVIEDHHNLEARFPARKILNVKFVDDVTLYKQRKVKILNGSHTLMVPVSYLAGHDTVLETMNDPKLLRFVKGFIFKEVIPTIDLPRNDMIAFANSVLERYANPFVRHELMSISLNSVTKYKTRILDSVTKNLSMGVFPKNALYSLAALIVFYKGSRNGEVIKLSDNPEFLELFSNLWTAYDNKEITSDEVVSKVLGLKEHWEADLTTDEVLSYVQKCVKLILEKGMINDFFEEELNYQD